MNVCCVRCILVVQNMNVYCRKFVARFQSNWLRDLFVIMSTNVDEFQ